MKAMDDIIAMLEGRRSHFNKAIDDAIRAIRAADAGSGNKAAHAPNATGHGSTINLRDIAASLRAGSLLEKTVSVLPQDGKPMHIDEILKRLGEGTDRGTLASALDRGTKRGAIKKVAPATYARVKEEDREVNEF